MPAAPVRVDFRPLAPADLPLLAEWLQRPHVAAWWGDAGSAADVARDFLPLTRAAAPVTGHVALVDGAPFGFVQCYVVAGAGDGWWEDETDPGARGIDQFVADADRLGRGLGSAMVGAFVERLFADPAVTKVQTDPAPHNVRAIRCYRRAGFVPQGEVVTPDGPALLMVRTRNEGAGTRPAPEGSEGGD
jgi:RimJ/RimL family protein N-acetyltransferase